MKKLFMDSSKIIFDKAYQIDERKTNGIVINHFKVDEENEKDIKRIKGDYYSIHFDQVTIQTREKVIKKELLKILKVFFQNDKLTKPLIIGLGNSSILCDSLGVHVTNKVMATNHFTDFLNLPKVALFNPEVTEKTGIRSYRLIEMVVKDLKPTVIIMIDSLVTNQRDYLNYSIEINNTGIIPGNAIHDNKKIDQSTFGVSVIAIGVPLVLEQDKSFYTSPNVGEVVELTSKIISDALNDLFF